MVSKMMQNLGRNMLRMDKTMMQAATGKKIHLPSDDPVAISRSMKIKADLSQFQQYKKNVDDVVSFLETTELAVKNVGDALAKVRELTVQASNGVLTDSDMVKIKEEITELKNQIISIGNTTYAGKYIFSGKKTDQPLFDANGNYNVNLENKYDPTLVDDKVQFEVGVNDRIEINSLGFEIFDSVTFGNILEDADGNLSVSSGVPEDPPNPAIPADKSGLIQLIESLEKFLEEGDNASLTGSLDKIDHYINVNLTARSQIGAKVNRMDLVKNRIVDDTVNFTKLQSELEDADMAEVYTRLLAEENVYRSSLSIGARIIQPSLLDFLR